MPFCISLHILAPRTQNQPFLHSLSILLSSCCHTASAWARCLLPVALYNVQHCLLKSSRIFQGTYSSTLPISSLSLTALSILLSSCCSSASAWDPTCCARCHASSARFLASSASVMALSASSLACMQQCPLPIWFNINAEYAARPHQPASSANLLTCRFTDTSAKCMVHLLDLLRVFPCIVSMPLGLSTRGQLPHTPLSCLS